MYNILFDNVHKSYGKKEVIRRLNFEIKENERLVFLGPSGCGKSTTLRMIAGFEEISRGDLYMGGRRVNDMAPGERNIAMVFQSYALFPHMDVWDNINFGLRIRKTDPAEIERRAKLAIEMLNLQGYEHQAVHALSGGQKQRVALCRALVKESPYFLLDEPLSNLDAQLRQKARQDLVRIHEARPSTMVYVTHDQVEAMTIGQRIAVLHEGTLQQIATPGDIYNNPANTFVASFIGSPAMNLIRASLDGGRLVSGGQRLDLPDGWRRTLAGRDEVIFGIRPEKVHIVSATDGMLRAPCHYAEHTGNLQTTSFGLAEQTLFTQSSDNQCDIHEGDVAGLSFHWDNARFFDAADGSRIVPEDAR